LLGDIITGGQITCHDTRDSSVRHTPSAWCIDSIPCRSTARIQHGDTNFIKSGTACIEAAVAGACPYRADASCISKTAPIVSGSSIYKSTSFGPQKSMRVVHFVKYVVPLPINPMLAELSGQTAPILVLLFLAWFFDAPFPSGSLHQVSLHPLRSAECQSAPK